MTTKLIKALKLAMEGHLLSDPEGLSEALNKIPWLEPQPDHIWVATQDVCAIAGGRIRVLPSMVNISGFESNGTREGDALTLLQQMSANHGYRVQ